MFMAGVHTVTWSPGTDIPENISVDEVKDFQLARIEGYGSATGLVVVRNPHPLEQNELKDMCAGIPGDWLRKSWMLDN